MPSPSAAANRTSATISGRSAEDFVLRAEKAAYGSGVGFEFLPKQFGEVRPDGTISKSPAAEFHPERDEILETPLIREPVPDCGDPFRRFGQPFEDVVQGLWPAPVDDGEEYLLFVVEVGVEGAAGIACRLADLIHRGIVVSLCE